LLTNSGTVTAARAPGITVTQQMVPAATGTGVTALPNSEVMFINGLDDTTQARLAMMPGVYISHFNHGVYGYAADTSDWGFSPIWENTVGLYGADLSEPGTSSVVVGGPKMGWGNTTPLVVSLDGMATTDTFIIRVTMAVEYMPRASSMMSELAGPSPCEDPVALTLYQSAIRTLPAFVPAKENAGFWDRFLNFVSGAAGVVGSIVPHPLVKGIAAGVGGIASGLRNLIFGE